MSYGLSDYDSEIYPLERQGLKVLRLRFENKALPAAGSRYFWFAWAFKRVQQLLFSIDAARAGREEQFDVLHIHSPVLWLVTFLVPISKKNIYLSFHGSDLPKVLRSWLFQLLLSRVGTFCVTSKEFKCDLEQKYPTKRIEHVGNGVNSRYFVAGGHTPTERAKTILAVGRLSWLKNFELLLSSFRQIADEFDDWNLVIVGEGERRKPLETLIETLGLGGRVELRGALSRGELAKVYRDARLIAVSSSTEALPKVLLEGMCAGLIPVVTDVGDCASVVEGYGVVATSMTPHEFSRALIAAIDLSDAPGIYNAISAHAAGMYDWDAFRSRYDSVYRAYC